MHRGGRQAIASSENAATGKDKQFWRRLRDLPLHGRWRAARGTLGPRQLGTSWIRRPERGGAPWGRYMAPAPHPAARRPKTPRRTTPNAGQPSSTC